MILPKKNFVFLMINDLLPKCNVSVFIVHILYVKDPSESLIATYVSLCIFFSYTCTQFYDKIYSSQSIQ